MAAIGIFPFILILLFFLFLLSPPIYIRAKERTQLIIVVLLVIAVAAGTLFFVRFFLVSGDLTVDYEAVLTIDNFTLFLNESYIYHVNKEKFRMLYRTWKAPMLVEGYFYSPHFLQEPHITAKNVVGDGIGYAKDCGGNVKIFNEKDIEWSQRSAIVELAEKNEVGIYNPSKFRKGSYKAEYFFTINPPVKTDGKFDHINLKLADEHVPYSKVRIVIVDPNKKIVKLYPHLPGAKLRKSGDTWIIEGSAIRDELVEVEMLLEYGAVNGYLERVENVEKSVEDANRWYGILSVISTFLYHILLIIIPGFPFLVIYVYRRYGTEKEFIVPEYISFVPKKRKPWLVNLVFKGDAFTFDEHGFYATLLDLHRKGYIRIEPCGKHMIIRILRRFGDDEYENIVLRFLLEYAENGIVDTEKLEEIAKGDISEARILHKKLEKVLNYRNKEISKEFVENKGKVIFSRFFLITFAFIIFLSLLTTYLNMYIPLKNELIILSFALSIQCLICLCTPSQFFGRWKEDFYKEKLEWDAFRKFLSDMAMIKKYAPQDIVIWKEWLIYGTALGVGKNVAETMRSLNIGIPEIYILFALPTFHRINTTARRRVERGSGFGAGGGFGGGGAGGR